jgi:hypothetical protein
VALQHDLGARGHAQLAAQGLDQFRAATAQKSGKLVFGQAVGYGRHRAQYRGRVGANGYHHRIGLAGVLLAMLAKIQRATPVRQPAHDDLVAVEYLLAVDAQVLARLVGALRDDQAPGDQRCHIAGPAVLDRQARQVQIIAFPHHLLTRCTAQLFGRHVPQRFEQTAHAHHFLEALGRLGLLE